MFSKKRSKIKAEFEINYPTRNHIFNPTYRSITGTVKLSVLQDLKNIKCIDIGFRGDCFTEYNLITLAAGPTLLGGSGAAMRSKTLKDTRNIFEFEIPNAFPGLFDEDSSASTISLTQGQKFESPISFEFPVDLNLPSTCHNLGGRGENMGSVTIRYQVYVSVHYISDFLNKDSYFEYVVPLDYQGGAMLGLGEDSVDIYNDADDAFINCSTSGVFSDKMKVFVLDKITGTLSENKLRSSHKRTRFVRKLWNDDYKESNISKVSKDIKLDMTVQIPLLFNIVSPLSAIPITIKCPMSDGLDFGVNGKTTRLGYFEILEVSLNLKHEIFLSCQFRTYSCRIQEKIFYKSFKSEHRKRPSFDIHDFTYDPKVQTYIWVTTLGDLLKHESPLIEQIQTPIMADVMLDDIFSNSNNLEIKLVVSNGQIDGKQTQKFRFQSPTCLTCKHPEFVGTNVGPPMYTAVISPEYHDVRDEPPPYLYGGT